MTGTRNRGDGLMIWISRILGIKLGLGYYLPNDHWRLEICERSSGILNECFDAGSSAGR